MLFAFHTQYKNSTKYSPTDDFPKVKQYNFPTNLENRLHVHVHVLLGHGTVPQGTFAHGRRWQVIAVVAGPARPQSKPRQPDRIAYAVQQPLLERLVLHVVVQGVGVAKVEVGHLHDEAFPVLDVVGDAEHHQNHRQQAEPDRDDDDRELRFGLICGEE